jgi:hypothetical protein
VGREERRLLGCGDDEAAPPLYIYTARRRIGEGSRGRGQRTAASRTID